MRKRSDPRFTRAASTLIPLVNVFARRGGDAEALLARNNLPFEAMTDPTLLIDASSCYAAIEDMAETLGDRYFGAHVALEAARIGTPLLRDAARQATTLADFLSRAIIEIASQVDNVRYELSVSPEIARFEIQRTFNLSSPTIQVDAIGVAFYASVIKRGLGRTFDPERMIVTVPTTKGLPAGVLPSRSIVTSDINGLRISFPPQWLWAPFSLDWRLPEAPRGHFGSTGAREATLDYFRGVLAANLGAQDLPLNQFARLCGLHPRRVQRILAAWGTSYRQLRDEARKRLVLDLMSNTSTPIAEIAWQAGFSGPSALNRAFRQWTGKTPTSFRGDFLKDRGRSQQDD